jgi:hypothetical protein
LLFGGKNEFWLIDHGHCITGPSWKPSELNADGDYRNRLAEWLTSRMDLVQKKKRSGEAVSFAASIAPIDINAAATGSGIRAILPPSEVAAVESFLTERAKNVPRHASKALGVPLML